MWSGKGKSILMFTGEHVSRACILRRDDKNVYWVRNSYVGLGSIKTKWTQTQWGYSENTVFSENTLYNYKNYRERQRAANCDVIATEAIKYVETHRTGNGFDFHMCLAWETVRMDICFDIYKRCNRTNLWKTFICLSLILLFVCY